MSRIFFFMAFLAGPLVGVTQPYFVPDTNLRNFLNGPFPVVDEGGYLIDPDMDLGDLGIYTDAGLPPVDLTGLEHVLVRSLRLSNLGGGSFSNFPGFPRIIPANDQSAYIRLMFFNGDEIPSLPENLAYLQIWEPLRIGAWSLSGHDDEVYTNVELTLFPDTVPMPDMVERVDYLAFGDWPHETLPIMGEKVREISVFNAPILGRITLDSPDLETFDASGCPLLTSLTVTEAVDSLRSFSIGTVPSLVELSALPVVETLMIGGTTAIGSLEIADCTGNMEVSGFLGNAIRQWPPSTKQLSIHSIVGLDAGDLPDGLEILSISECYEFRELPDLPTSLQTLNVSNTSVQELGMLPEGLEYLTLIDNHELECIPPLPTTLIHLVSSQPCHPNQPPLVAPISLCTIVNSNCPDVNPTVAGHVFLDIDGDGTQDDFELDARNVTIRFAPSGHMTGTDAMGNYIIGLPPGGHTVTVEHELPYFNTVRPEQHEVWLPHLLDAATGMDFALGATDEMPLDRSVVAQSDCPPRPGFERIIRFEPQTLTWGSVNTLIIEIDPTEEFISAGFPVTSIVGSTITSINEVSVEHYFYRVRTPVVAELGSLLTHSITVGPIDGDPTPWNNTYLLTDTVVGSFDPNDKQAFPALLTPSEVAADTSIEYLIRFQNTGTYEAERVVITDTLSSDLRWNTFRFIQSSHSCKWFIRGGVAHFVFDGIHLPDSNANEPESHGFVRFSIRPRTDLRAGEMVTNEANIYFDFNEPVITEPCILAVEVPTGMKPLHVNAPHTYPIPTHNVLNLVLPDTDAYNAVVLSMDGRMMMAWSTLRSGTCIDVSALAPGAYVLALSTPTQTIHHVRFVKE